MVFVFAALGEYFDYFIIISSSFRIFPIHSGEFVVVKVLDVQYQQQSKSSSQKPLQIRLNAMEKGQAVANWDGTNVNVRSRKAPSQTPTTPGQTSLQGNGGPPPKPTRRQSIISVSWHDADTGIEKIMWREIDKLSRLVFPALFLVFVILYWPILILKTS